MMTVAGAAFLMFALVQWFFGGISIHGAFPLFWGVPFMVSCILADIGAAAGMAGIEKITKAGETVITEARMSWRSRH